MHHHHCEVNGVQTEMCDTLLRQLKKMAHNLFLQVLLGLAKMQTADCLKVNCWMPCTNCKHLLLLMQRLRLKAFHKSPGRCLGLLGDMTLPVMLTT